MKAKTYARLSLLLPFLLWGLCLLYSLVTNSLEVKQPDSFLSIPIVNSIGQFITFYVFGIIFWLLPYLLLALILFALTFKSQEKLLLRVYLLSPLAMAVLMMAEVAILLLMGPDTSLSSFDPATSLQSSLGLFIVFGFPSLVWGYICVCISFGLYKLLQNGGALRPTPERRLAPGLADN
jgi:hypothetical protein